METNSIEKPRKGSLNYKLRAILSFVIACLLIYFVVSPSLERMFSKAPSWGKEILNEIIIVICVGSIIIFFITILFWKIVFRKINNQLKNEEKEIQKIPEINLGDFTSKERLQQIRRKRKLLLALIQRLFIFIVLLTVIGFLLAYYLLFPILFQ